MDTPTLKEQLLAMLDDQEVRAKVCQIIAQNIRNGGNISNLISINVDARGIDARGISESVSHGIRLASRNQT